MPSCGNVPRELAARTHQRAGNLAATINRWNSPTGKEDFWFQNRIYRGTLEDGRLQPANSGHWVLRLHNHSDDRFAPEAAGWPTSARRPDPTFRAQRVEGSIATQCCHAPWSQAPHEPKGSRDQPPIPSLGWCWEAESLAYRLIHLPVLANNCNGFAVVVDDHSKASSRLIIVVKQNLMPVD